MYKFVQDAEDANTNETVIRDTLGLRILVSRFAPGGLRTLKFYGSYVANLHKDDAGTISWAEEEAPVAVSFRSEWAGRAVGDLMGYPRVGFCRRPSSMISSAPAMQIANRCLMSEAVLVLLDALLPWGE